MALAGCLGAAGCGSSAGTVSGKVYYKNEPLKGGTVTFAVNEQNFPGEIREDGSYSVPRVPPGEAKVAVETASLRPANPMALKNKPPSDAQNVNMPDLEARAKRFVPIPDKYGDPSKSGLKYTVTPGSQTHDIKLD